MSDITTEEKTKTEKIPVTCGIVMPISQLDSCSSQHWLDVKAILCEAIVDAGFEPNMVFEAEESGIIQKRIIENLYLNPIVICDVSGKNPNVMFELGMRLAFDKPTIIVKDDKTDYSFDTSPIEHLPYPRDLRFNRIVQFKRELTEKLRSTVDRAEKDPTYTTFLKNFGPFKVAALETRTVSKEEFILDQMSELRFMMSKLLTRETRWGRSQSRSDFDSMHGLDSATCTAAIVSALTELVQKGVPSVAIQDIKWLLNAGKRHSDKFPPCLSDADVCREKIVECLAQLRLGLQNNEAKDVSPAVLTHKRRIPPLQPGAE